MTTTEALLQLLGTLAAPLTDVQSRTWLPSLAIAALLAIAFTAWTRRGAAWREVVREGLALSSWRHGSTVLDLQIMLVRQLLGLLGLIPRLGSAWLLATWLVRTLDRSVGVPQAPELPGWVLSIAYTVVLFLAWDVSRYVLHRAMHGFGPLWQLHQVHHSAEVLTPLTFHRIHPVESALYELRSLLVGGATAGVAFWLYRGAAVELTVLGVHAFGLVLNVATGNLRHSHVWLRYGRTVERWLLSPAQHQIHHSADPAECNSNFGNWLAIWDRMGGTLRIAGERPPVAFGIPAAVRNHAPDHLVQALVLPVVAMVRRTIDAAPRPVGPAAAVLLALAGGRAVAGEDDAAQPTAAASDEEDVPAEPSEAPAREDAEEDGDGAEAGDDAGPDGPAEDGAGPDEPAEDRGPTAEEAAEDGAPTAEEIAQDSVPTAEEAAEDGAPTAEEAPEAGASASEEAAEDGGSTAEESTNSDASAPDAAAEDGAPPDEPTDHAAPAAASSSDETAPVVEKVVLPRDESRDSDYEIVVVAEDGVPRVAGSAHVIGEEELTRYEYDDVQRILAKVPGVYVRGEDGHGLRPNIGIRGANSDRSAKVTLLEDGVPLAPAPYAAPAAYYFPMPTRLAGVEVFKGPAATRHGPQTVGGAINLLTRQVPNAPLASVDLATGMHGTLKGHGYAGFGGDRGGVLAEVAHLSSGGFKQLDGGGPTGFDRQDVMVKGRLDAETAGARHALELKLGYGREHSNETYLGLTLDDFEANPYRRYAASANDVMRWQRSQAELSWRVRLGSVDVRTVAYHHGLSRAWTKLNGFAGGPDLHTLLQNPDGGQAAVYVGILRGEEDSITSDQLLAIGTNDRRFSSYGVQTLVRHEAWGERVQHELEVGVRLHGDDVRRLHTEDPYAMKSGELHAAGGETLTTLDSVTTARALAAHAHEDLAIGRFHVLPGARVEVIRTAAGTPETGAIDPITRVVPLPGLGLMGEISDAVHVFGGVHRGFSPVAPGQEEEVRPETSWSYEAGVRATPPESHVEVVAFFSDYQNLTGQCTLSGGCNGDQLDQQFSGGEAWIYGVEAVLSRRLNLPGDYALRGELAWTWTHAEFRTGFVSGFPQFGTVQAGDRLPYVPAHQGAGRLLVEHPYGSVGVAVNARTAMRDVAGADDITAANGVPGYAILDLVADVAVSEHVDFYGRGTNLTGSRAMESWRPFGARPVAPFQVMVGVKAGF